MTETLTIAEDAETRPPVTYPYVNGQNAMGAEYLVRQHNKEGGLDWARIRAEYESRASAKELWLEREAVAYKGGLTGMAKRGMLEERYRAEFEDKEGQV